MKRVWRIISSEDEMGSLYEDLNDALFQYAENNEGKKIRIELTITKEGITK